MLMKLRNKTRNKLFDGKSSKPKNTHNRNLRKKF